MYQPETKDNICNLRQDVLIKKEVFKHVSHERSILMKQCRSRGLITRYTAVLIDNSNPINHSVATLHKFCNHHPDMHMTSHASSFTLYVNNEPLLTIKKKKGTWKQNGGRWIIEKYVNPNSKPVSTFQHGYVYVLRVPMMPVRMGIFFKAPIDQDFANFNNHYRTKDTNDIIEYALHFPIMDKPQHGSNYIKLSNTLDLSNVFNDVWINRSIKELQVCHGSKKNFTVHQLHSIYSPRTQRLPVNEPSSPAHLVQFSDQCSELQDNTLDDMFYVDEQSGTKDASPDALTKYISMTRYDKNFYLTTFNAPVTPVIAFIASVLSCTSS